MPDADPQAGLTHVATVAAFASRWDGLPGPSEIVVGAIGGRAVIVVPGVATLLFTPDNAALAADDLAEAGAAAGNVDRVPMTQGEHNRAMFARLGLEWL